MYQKKFHLQNFDDFSAFVLIKIDKERQNLICFISAQQPPFSLWKDEGFFFLGASLKMFLGNFLKRWIMCWKIWNVFGWGNLWVEYFLICWCFILCNFRKTVILLSLSRTFWKPGNFHSPITSIYLCENPRITFWSISKLVWITLWHFHYMKLWFYFKLSETKAQLLQFFILAKHLITSNTFLIYHSIKI